MTYLQHKNKSRFFIWVPQAVLLVAVFAFFLWPPAGNFLKSWSVKIIDFFVPEKRALEKSLDQLLMLARIRDLEAENKRLTDLFGKNTDRNTVPLTLSFGGGYLFLDTFFLKGAVDSVSPGEWVLSGDIILGKIIETGRGFAKFKSIGSLGERAALRAGENKEIVFEAVGYGGGELKVLLPSSLALKVGDQVWWGEDPRYLAGLVEEVRVRETSPSAEVIIITPIRIESLSEVEVLRK